MIRTDLAVESLEMATLTDTSGVETKKVEQGGIIISRIRVLTDEVAQKIGKPVGEYITFSVSDFKGVAGNIVEEAETVADILAEFLPKNERGVLVVGLGNEGITPDALGPACIKQILATRHISKELKAELGMENLASVAAIATGVLGNTGIETAEVVSSLCAKLSPSYVIVIDALAAKSVARLCNTIQVANTGISPGSGVQNARKPLNMETLGVPVVAIGVPTVVDMSTIAMDMQVADEVRVSDDGRAMMVTPREIDLCIEHAARLVAFAINKALQPELSMDEITSLVG